MATNKHGPELDASEKSGEIAFWVYANVRGTDYTRPYQALRCVDTDETWAEFLPDPEIYEDKRDSPAICGLEFTEGAENRTLEHAHRSHAMVLDVDVWEQPQGSPFASRAPFTADELRERLEGFRFIAWNSFSSTAALPKWRVIIPLASSMPPTKYRALWRIINQSLDGCMSEVSTADPTRLGFVGTVASEHGRDAYTWFINPGERLDWTLFDLQAEELSVFRKALTPKDLSRSVDWSSDTEALESCKRYYRRVGRDVEEGSRHETLLRASCRLWWDWAAPNDTFVETILEIINSNFPQPKTEQEVINEVHAGYERSLGERRVEQASSYGSEREPIIRASLQRFAEHARALKKRNHDHSRIVGRALASVADKESFADPVEARTLAFHCADEVAKLFPRESPERLIELLRPAFDAQQAKSKVHPMPTDTELASKIKWTQRSRVKAYEEREQVNKDVRRRQILSASGGARDSEYTPRELKEWEAKGFSHNQWILQHDRVFYFFVEGSYRGPYSKDAANNFAATWLAPASEWVHTQVTDAKGNVKTRTVDDLVQEYGSFVEEVYRSLTATESEYRFDTRKLTVPATPIRDLEPAFNADVERWLKALGGNKYESLMDWLAALTLLDRPCAALFMCMAPGLGKNLFTHGLARIWTTAGPTALEGYESLDLETCPLLFCNEELPDRWKKSFASKLRAFLDETSRKSKRLYSDKYSLIGCPRVIIIANNSKILTGSAATESLSTTDVRALKERVLMIEEHDRDNAHRFLIESIPNHRDFVDRDILAKHVLWIKENRKLDGKKRFFVNDLGTEFENAFIVGQSSKSQTLEWIHEYLSQGKFPTTAILAKDGVLYANSTMMLANWELHDTSKKGIRSRELMTALAAVAPTRKDVATEGKEEQTYRELNMEAFYYWVGQNDGNEKHLRQAIKALEAKRPITKVWVK